MYDTDVLLAIPLLIKHLCYMHDTMPHRRCGTLNTQCNTKMIVLRKLKSIGPYILSMSLVCTIIYLLPTSKDHNKIRANFYILL